MTTIDEAIHFRNGGVIIRGIPGTWFGTASAWFNADGVLVRVERFAVDGSPMPKAKIDGWVWATLADIQIDRMPLGLT